MVEHKQIYKRFKIIIKMVQELHVLRCYSCNIFQVQIVKKVNKWQCKICNDKQSVKKGSGQECRIQVQQMNLRKHIKEEEEFETLKTLIEENEEEEEDFEKAFITESKWTKYMVEEMKNEKEIEMENLNLIKKNIDENKFSYSNRLGENNYLSAESEIENSESENLVYFNKNSSLHLSTNNENYDDNYFREINFLKKRKFEDDRELNSDYSPRSKRTKFNDLLLDRKKNLRDIIKSNRKENGKLFDENKSAEKDSEINKYSTAVDRETIHCKYDVKKKTVFQSDLDDFDDNFDL